MSLITPRNKEDKNDADAEPSYPRGFKPTPAGKHLQDIELNRKSRVSPKLSGEP